MSVEVRPLREDDHAEWRRLWTAYLAFYETTVPQEVYEITWARLMGEDPRDVRGLVAEVEGRPAGLTQFLFHRHGWKTRDVCYLQDLYADPEMRGSGVGRALIEAVYAAADARGAPDVYWLTQEHNHAARRLYDRIGRATPFMRYVRA